MFVIYDVVVRSLFMFSPNINTQTWGAHDKNV